MNELSTKDALRNVWVRRLGQERTKMMFNLFDFSQSLFL